MSFGNSSCSAVGFTGDTWKDRGRTTPRLRKHVSVTTWFQLAWNVMGGEGPGSVTWFNSFPSCEEWFHWVILRLRIFRGLSKTLPTFRSEKSLEIAVDLVTCNRFSARGYRNKGPSRMSFWSSILGSRNDISREPSMPWQVPGAAGWRLFLHTKSSPSPNDNCRSQSVTDLQYQPSCELTPTTVEPIQSGHLAKVKWNWWNRTDGCLRLHIQMLRDSKSRNCCRSIF